MITLAMAVISAIALAALLSAFKCMRRGDRLNAWLWVVLSISTFVSALVMALARMQ